MNIKNIFFDFDGVLAESVNVKTEAFYKLYLPYGEEVAKKVVKHHKAHGGVSRFEKFKIYHEQFLGEHINEQKVRNLANQFSNLVVDGVVEAPEVPGAKHFLDSHNQSIKYWVITGTPTKEIKEIIKQRGLESYFIELCGSPTKKPKWTEYLLNKYDLEGSETLFLGDAKSDYEAATSSGLHFALRDYHENKGLFQDYNGLRFSNFKDLENQINLR